MASTKINLARQALGRIFTFGSSAAGGNGKITIEKGTLPVSDIGLDVKASATVGGDLTVAGNFNFAGKINKLNVTDLDVEDKSITLNKGGAGGTADGSGLKVESGGVVVGEFRFNSASPTRFSVGDGTTQSNLVDSSTAQTLTNKTIQSAILTGIPTVPTATSGTNTTQVASTQFVQQEIASTNASLYFRATTITGTQDATNKVFTLSDSVSAGSEQIFINGQLLNAGASNDYVLSGTGNTTLTFQSGFIPPESDDILRAYGVR